MAEKHLSSFWHPRQWSVMTWLISFVWLLFAVGQNIYIEPPVEPSPVPGHPDIFADRVQLVGWPATHTEVRRRYDFPATRSTEPLMAIADVFAIALVQIAIVAVGYHWFRQFSLRTLFVAMGFFAVALVVGRWSVASNDPRIALAFVYLVYFLPVIFWAVAIAQRFATLDRAEKAHDKD